MSIYFEPDHWFIIQLKEYTRNNSLTEEELSSLKDQIIPGPKHCDEIKEQISQSNKEYYLTERGRARRSKIAARNAQIKSDEMKKRWSENYESMKAIRQGMGRTKGSKDLKPRQKKYTIRQITDGNNTYKDAYEAAEVYGINPVNIRRKCRKMIGNWRYI